MIEVCEYDPAWTEKFEELKRRIWPFISDHADRIEHIGSTAVEGLSAKPVIDLDIVIKSENSLPGVIEGLAKLGYRHRGDLGIEGREAFKCEGSDFKHHLYVCLEGCLAFRNHITLRDHLRKNAFDRNRYSDVKKELAAKFSEDVDSYVEGKTEFILSILRQYEMGNDELAAVKKANKNPNYRHR
jgi:GrpB-like predicted nucleotidyltransferase (UPF0157 family)